MTNVDALAAHPGRGGVRGDADVGWPTAAVVILGIAALLARPLVARGGDGCRLILIVMFVCLGLTGVLWPVRHRSPLCSAPLAVAVLGVGVGAFAAGRLLVARPVAVSVPLVPLGLNALAAVTEEAFFRRLLYGVLAPYGRAVAIVGSGVAFAVVHVTVWGVGVLPLDLAAGLLLSWQRSATGRWSVPAVTHMAANVMAAL